MDFKQFSTFIVLIQSQHLYCICSPMLLSSCTSYTSYTSYCILNRGIRSRGQELAFKQIIMSEYRHNSAMFSSSSTAVFNHAYI